MVTLDRIVNSKNLNPIFDIFDPTYEVVEYYVVESILCITTGTCFEDYVSNFGIELKGDDYIALDRFEKVKRIWYKLISNTQTGVWHDNEALLVSMWPSFTTDGDEFDCTATGCRPKVIHSIGVVGKAIWTDYGGHPYTGMFKGGDSGIIRLSVGVPVFPTNVNPFMPSLSIKFLRDGIDSANLVAMESGGGQASFNFFEKDFTTQIPLPPLTPSENSFLSLQIPQASRFQTTTDYITSQGTSNFASFTQDGYEESPVVIPFLLRFEPTG